MSELVAALFTVAFLSQVVRITIPYALAALGGVTAERSGVIDLALEGKLLVAALAAAIGADLSGSVLVGGTMALVEPAVNTVAYYLHEKVWARAAVRQRSMPWRPINAHSIAH